MELLVRLRLGWPNCLAPRLGQRSVGVDPSASAHHNRLLDNSEIKIDRQSAALMRRKDTLYTLATAATAATAGTGAKCHAAAQPSADCYNVSMYAVMRNRLPLAEVRLPQRRLPSLLGNIEPLHWPVFALLPRAADAELAAS